MGDQDGVRPDEEKFQTDTSTTAYKSMASDSGVHLFIYANDPVPRLAGGIRNLTGTVFAPLIQTPLTHGPVKHAFHLPSKDGKVSALELPLCRCRHLISALDMVYVGQHVESYYAWTDVLYENIIGKKPTKKIESNGLLARLGAWCPCSSGRT